MTIKEELVNIDALAGAIYMYGGNVVGKTPNGRETTLIEELTEVGKLIDKAELILCRDYYNPEYRKLRRNFTEEELVDNAKKSIVRAGKKLLFLNSVAKGLEVPFITEKVDKADTAELYRLLKSYQWAICSWNVI